MLQGRLRTCAWSVARQDPYSAPVRAAPDTSPAPEGASQLCAVVVARLPVMVGAVFAAILSC